MISNILAKTFADASRLITKNQSTIDRNPNASFSTCDVLFRIGTKQENALWRKMHKPRPRKDGELCFFGWFGPPNKNSILLRKALLLEASIAINDYNERHRL